ncbi:MAG: hypothetical protein AMXMBFR57_06880 [Acidimicrobiia bacterium]
MSGHVRPSTSIVSGALVRCGRAVGKAHGRGIWNGSATAAGYRSSEVPGFRSSGVPNFRSSEVPEFRSAEVPGFRGRAAKPLRYKGLPVDLEPGPDLKRILSL